MTNLNFRRIEYLKTLARTGSKKKQIDRNGPKQLLSPTKTVIFAMRTVVIAMTTAFVDKNDRPHR